MSTTVDQRVVEMRFDNAQFERNVATSMSTLDKLKHSLHLTGAAKGLDSINAAAKNNNLSTLGSAAETVGLKFNAMYTMADQALRNITNKVQHTATSMINALTLDPIKTGFQEYETQINAVQTILANTESKGTTIDDVNRALEELNTYADKTIYNFTEMTRNIGTFTAAGIGLEESTAAIQGIANLAAVSGSNSQQASTAMYQLSQAMAAGTVKLMDWNSVVNAGMGGQVFQDALKATARAHGIAVDEIIEANGSFRESLQEGWITTEILTETLSKMTQTGAAEYLANLTGVELKQIEAAQELVATNKDGTASYDKLAEKLAATGKITKEEAINILKMADTATDAATKVKTFTQLWDVLKESAQSGWSQTWKLIIGDFEEAKNLLSPLADVLTGFIGKMSDARNKVLEIALDSPFAKIIEKVQNVTKATEKVVEATKDYAAIVDKVIGGSYGTGQARWDKLAEEGYNWAKVQNMVNEQLGSTVRHNEGVAETQEKVNKTQATTIEQLAEMSEGQLRSLGFTTEEIQALKDLKDTADKAGYSLSEVVNNPELLNGRNLLIDGFKNIGTMLIEFGKSAKYGWEQIFPPKSVEERAEKLYNIIAGFRKLTAGMKFTLFEEDGKTLTDTGDKLVRTFKGLAAAVDIVLTVVGGPLKWAFDAAIQLLGTFNIDILDVTANVGDVIVKIRDWIDKNNLLVKGLELIAGFLKTAGNGIKEWAKGLEGANPKEVADAIVSGLGKAVKYVGTVLDQLRTLIIDKAKSIGGYLVEGLEGGIRDKIKFVWEVIKELANNVIMKFCEITGIESPSKVFYALGGFLVMGLLMGIKAFAPQVWEYIKSFASECIGVFEGVDFGAIFTALISTGALTAIIKIADAFQNFSKPMAGLGEMLDSFGEAVERASKGVKAFLKGWGKLASGLGFKFKAEGIFKISLAIAVLAGSVFLLAQLDGAQLSKALVAVLMLSSIIIALMLVVDKLNDAEGIKDAVKNGLSFGSLIAIAASLVLVGIALQKMANIDEDKVGQAIGCFLIAIGGIAAIIAVIGKTVKGKTAMNFKQFGSVMLKLSFTLLLLVGVLKLASMISPEDAKQGGIVVGALAAGVLAMITGIGLVNKYLGGTNFKSLGSNLLKVTFALLLLLGTVKLASMLSVDDAKQGGIVVGAIAAGILVMVAGLAAVNKFMGGTFFGSLGGNLLKISLAILLMVGVIKLASGLSSEEATRGGIIVGSIAAGILLMVAGFALINNKIGSATIDKLGITLLSIAGAMLILSFVSKIIGSMEWGEMAKAGVGILFLGGIIVGLVAATKLVTTKDLAKLGSTLILLSASIAILAGVAAMLGMLEIDHLKKGIVAVSVLAIMTAILVSSAKNAQKCVGTIVALTVAIALLAIAVAALSFIDADKLSAASASLTIVIGMFAILVKASNNVKASLGTIIIMTVVVGLLAGVLYLLADLPADSVLSSAKALSLVIIALSAAMFLLDKANGVSPKALISVGVMVLVVGALGGLLYLLDGLSVESSLQTVGSISLLLGAMLVTLAILQFIKPSALTGVGSLALLSLVVGALGLILGALEKYDLAPSMETVNALSKMLFTMTAVLAILTIIGLAGPAALVGVGSLAALIVGIGGIIVAIGALMEKFPMLEEFLNTGIPIIEKIGDAIGSFFGNMVGGFLDGVASSLPDVGDHLSGFMENAQGFFDGVTNIGKNGETVVTGVKAVAAAIMALSAADLMAGIASWLQNGSSFTDLGSDLSGFMSKAGGFFSGLANIDADTVAAAKMIAEIVLAITAAQLLDGIAGWIAGGQNLDTFSAQLTSFGDAMVNFSKKVSEGINVEAVQAAATAGDIMVALTKSLPKTDGILQWIMGEQNLETFGTQLTAFGGAIVGFSKKVSEGVNIEAVQAAATAGDIMVKLTKALPKTDGLLQWIMGQQNLSTFGIQLRSFGSAIVGFSKTVSEEGAINTEAITAAGNAGSIMVALAKDLPTTGGLLQWIMGEKNLATFGAQMTSFGEGIAGFSGAVAGNIDTGAIDTAISAAKRILSLDKEITDGAYDASLGDPDIVDLAQVATKFGKEMADFGEAVSGTDFSKVSSSVSNAEAIANLCTKIKSLDTSGVDTLKSAIDSLSTAKVGDFTTTFSESMTTYTTRVSQLTSMITKLAGLDTSGVPGFKNAINTLGQTGVKDFIAAFSDADASLVKTGADMIAAIIDGIKSKKGMLKTDITTIVSDMVKAFNDKKAEFKKLGAALMMQLIEGIESNKRKIKSACTAGISSAVTSIRGYYDNFHSAGGYLAEGFAAGIKAKQYKAVNAAIKMVKKAIAAIEDEADINSPSKVSYKLGGFFGQGWVNALGDYARTSYSAGSEIADSARKGLTMAIGKVHDIINGDMDMNPTIRPVLDLSGVESGVGAIDGMFNGVHSVGAMANLRAISAMSSQNGQNGMDDVISAINKLGKNLGNVRGDTYNVNGVTYDDGSNVSNAIQTLIRAAKVERRA